MEVHRQIEIKEKLLRLIVTDLLSISNQIEFEVSKEELISSEIDLLTFHIQGMIDILLGARDGGKMKIKVAMVDSETRKKHTPLWKGLFHKGG